MSRFGRCLLFAAAIIPASRGAGQQLPAAQFTDPDRAAKLAAAYPAIDSLFAAMAAREHIPGAAWGIVIDGRLAHVSAAGVRDIATKAAGRYEFGVPHREHDEELHGGEHPIVAR